VASRETARQPKVRAFAGVSGGGKAVPALGAGAEILADKLRTAGHRCRVTGQRKIALLKTDWHRKTGFEHNDDFFLEQPKHSDEDARGLRKIAF